MTTNTCKKVYELPLYSCKLFINENLFVISKKVKHSRLLLSLIKRNLFLFLLYLNVKINNYLFVLCRFCFVDMLVFELWLLHEFTWPTLIELIKHDTPLATKEYWTNQNSAEHIKMLFVAKRSIFWKGSVKALFWTHFCWFITFFTSESF